MDQERIGLIKYVRRLLSETRHYEKMESHVRKFISSHTEEECEKALLDFLKWEENFEERLYKKGIQGESWIFHLLMSTFEERIGTRLDLEEDFLQCASRWKNFTFKLYAGQGSFWRILKDDKIIFQSA